MTLRKWEMRKAFLVSCSDLLGIVDQWILHGGVLGHGADSSISVRWELTALAELERLAPAHYVSCTREEDTSVAERAQQFNELTLHIPWSLDREAILEIDHLTEEARATVQR
jgi:hypothetical protein